VVVHRQDSAGVWGAFGALPQGASTKAPGLPLDIAAMRTVQGERISATTVGTHTYLCLMGYDGHLSIAERRGQPTVDAAGVPLGELMLWVSRGLNATYIWTDLSATLAAPGTPFIDIACAAQTDPVSGGDQLHLLGIGQDGRVWHGTASRALADLEASNFTPFAPITVLPPGASRIAAAAADNQLHVIALTTGGGGSSAGTWYTIRAGNGAWQVPEDVGAMIGGLPSGYGDVAVAFCDEDVIAPPPNPARQLNVALLSSNGRVDMAVRTSWTQGWGANGAPSQWLHLTQWAGMLSITAGPLIQAALPFRAVSLSERPFRP
jgi:hypothetical protein